MLRRIFLDVRERLGVEGAKRRHIFDKLEPLSEAEVERLVPEPSYGSLRNDLDAYLLDWLEKADGEPTRLILYPPASRERFLTGWAEQHGLKVLPCREGLHTDPEWADKMLAEIAAKGLVVIPDLHNGFLRTRGGLEAVSQLLTAISASPSKVVVGCNSYAWAFLTKAVNAHHFLPDPGVPQALDGARLRAWFREACTDAKATFHSLSTGGDVFADADPFFDDLAIASLGTPWSAWSLWRESLFTRPDSPEGHIWVKLPKSPTLPRADRRQSLLILHSLLIHGGLSPDALARTLPSNVPHSELAQLRREGIVGLVDGILDVTAKAYPMVRTALVDANHPVDGL